MELQNHPLLETEAEPQWKTIGIKHHHGINVPLFSLHSSKSCGIGEFTDLLPLIDWCREIGYDVIQLLPLNDTGPEHSPYSAISAFALNPLYLGLASLPYIDNSDLQLLIPPLQALTKSQRVDYSRVRQSKEEFLEKYYSFVGSKVESEPTFQKFKEENPWLVPYALFKSMKILLRWSPWENWGKELQDPTLTVYQHLVEQFKEEITHHIFVQYLCFQQMEKVKGEANAKGIWIKGDIPILIGRESADVWLYGLLFLVYYSAGAPPDMYSEKGQNWGFPIYDWDRMEKEDYRWWKIRLKVASRLYNIYRIDHVVGFFRIWAIPQGKAIKDGHYIPTQPLFWVPKGKKIMKMMLANCPMLPIGEDLGTVPDEVRECLSELGICGTKVMRWERLWENDKEFIDPKDYPPNSMTTVSTHDSDTLQLWWINNSAEAKEYCESRGWTYSAPLTKDKQYKMIRDSHHSNSLFHINLLNEYLALVPKMTWPMLSDERINIPNIVSERNWTYRFVPSVEEIGENKSLKQIMKELIK